MTSFDGTLGQRCLYCARKLRWWRVSVQCIDTAAGHCMPTWLCTAARFGMVPESPALKQWRTRSPLLVLGSHDWNTPREGEDLKCGGKLQAALLHAAAPRRYLQLLVKCHRSIQRSPLAARTLEHARSSAEFCASAVLLQCRLPGRTSVVCCALRLAAVRSHRTDGKELGGGAMLLVFENTTHDSYNDVLALFSTRLGWFLRRVSPHFCKHLPDSVQVRL